MDKGCAKMIIARTLGLGSAICYLLQLTRLEISVIYDWSIDVELLKSVCLATPGRYSNFPHHQTPRKPKSQMDNLETQRTELPLSSNISILKKAFNAARLAIIENDNPPHDSKLVVCREVSFYWAKSTENAIDRSIPLIDPVSLGEKVLGAYKGKCFLMILILITTLPDAAGRPRARPRGEGIWRACQQYTFPRFCIYKFVSLAICAEFEKKPHFFLLNLHL